jgi:hypothetical protein
VLTFFSILADEFTAIRAVDMAVRVGFIAAVFALKDSRDDMQRDGDKQRGQEKHDGRKVQQPEHDYSRILV